jgi:hypothetical protein
LGVFYNPSAPPIAAAIEVDASVAAVPEPSTSALLLAASAGLTWIGIVAQRAIRRPAQPE